ncbi:MAG: porin family protein, partial [Gemmatimonadaceae bacterium]
MRTLLLVGCAALVARAAAARAQVERPNVIVYGGFTLATMHGDSVPGPLHTGGFAAGAALAWRVASHVAIQPEVLFVQKGDDEADAFSGGVFTEHIRLNYVEVPVLLRVSSNAIAGVVPFLVGGPQVSFKTSCSIDVHGLPGNYTCAD